MRRFHYFALSLIILVSTLTLLLLPRASQAQDAPTKQYASLDRSFTFAYPDSWVIDDSISTTLVANNVNVLDQADEEFVPGDVRLQISAPQFTQWLLRVELGIGAQTAIETLVASFPLSDEGIRLIEAAKTIYRADIVGSPLDVMVLAVEAGDGGIGLVIAYTAVGDMANAESEIYGLAESMQFVQPTLDVAALTPISAETTSNLDLLAMWGGHTNWVGRLDINSDGTQVVSVDGDSGIRVWDITSGLPVGLGPSELPISAGPLFSADGQVVLGSTEGLIWVWDPTTLSKVREVNTINTTIWTMRFNADRTLLAVGGNDQVVHIFDFASGDEFAELTGHADAITDVIFSPDGTHLISSSWDETIRVWDVASGVEILQIQAPAGGLSTIDVSPDGTRLAGGGLDSNVYIYDLTTGDTIFTLPEHIDGTPVVSVSFAPDGRLLASGAQDSTIIIWDTNSGLPLVAAAGPDFMNDVRFSPDSKLLFAANDDYVIMVWGIRE